jgi:hypothetical protein
MLSRRIGRAQARRLAEAASIDDALAELSGTAYGRTVRPGIGLARAQRGIAETALWHVRVLAGWAPPAAIEAIRSLTAWFELANIEDHLIYLAGGEAPTPFSLGGLATAWDRVAETRTAAEARAALATSPWGDPGGDDIADVRLTLRLAWARRVLDAVDDATEWAAGAVALIVARELFLNARSPDELLARRPPGIGRAWRQASGLRGLRDALPAQAAWALQDAEDPAKLWRTEVAWWWRVEQDASALVHAPLMGEPWVVGSVVLLGVDAWRAGAALASAARGGAPEAVEVFDELG